MSGERKTGKVGVTMQRLRELNGYQKGVLILMAAMVLVFTVLYPILTSRQAYSYRDGLLLRTQEGENTVYQGKVYGETARFTVSPDQTVEFYYGEKAYGPYTVLEDPSLVDLPEGVRGIQLQRRGETFFYGGVSGEGETFRVYRQDGSQMHRDSSMEISFDAYGNLTSMMEPSAYTILEVMFGPELTHPGSWWGWVLGVVICVATALTILYADELFRFHLLFEISNVEEAEPSEWEMASRYISWTLLPVLALAVFIIGLLYW